MTYTIAREYDLIVRGELLPPVRPGIHGIPTEAFDALYDFFSSPVEGKSGDREAMARPSVFKSIPALRLRQWVGVIRTPDGTTLEILPKTHDTDVADTGTTPASEALTASRMLLFEMLEAAGKHYKVALPADLQTATIPVFEVVMRYVLEQVKWAIRKGLPHAYVERQEEHAHLRGRVDLSRQVRQPAHRAHLLHVVFDNFQANRPETRLVRLAVERIARQTGRDDTRRLARELLQALSSVPASQEVDRDFQRCRLERGFRHFAPVLESCRLILYELNPLSAGGTSRATAVLFDMNRLFESYVAHLLRQHPAGWTIQAQQQDHHLGSYQLTSGSEQQQLFALRPDLLIEREGSPLIIADTKWKRLNPTLSFPYGVSGADAYQMLAYSTVLQQDQRPAEVWLIYPWVPGLSQKLPVVAYPGHRTLRLVTVDLTHRPPKFNLD